MKIRRAGNKALSERTHLQGAGLRPEHARMHAPTHPRMHTCQSSLGMLFAEVKKTGKKPKSVLKCLVKLNTFFSLSEKVSNACHYQRKPTALC